VWEANHVWLIFVLVVCWTAYPSAFGSITSTLAVPLFVAAVGIILRGAAYALRSGEVSAREQRMIESVFGISSILTPFALGAAIGGIASGRVPVGNAKGDLATSWLNSTSILIGTLAVATAAYLAAVYLAADAVRLGSQELANDFRARALGAGLAAGAVALAGLGVVRQDARPIWDGLTGGAGLAAVIVSIACGAATLALVWLRRFEPARVTAALAVAAIVAGWGFAQSPTLLPGLSIHDAAAGRSTLVALLVSVALGAIVVVPSLALLFGLTLRGRFDALAAERAEAAALPGTSDEPVAGIGADGAVAVACLVIGGVLLLLFDSPWTNAIGGLFLIGFVASGSVALAKSGAALAAGDDGP
jgi:cytochrome d ubiquinol oxidase subunit II